MGSFSLCTLDAGFVGHKYEAWFILLEGFGHISILSILLGQIGFLSTMNFVCRFICGPNMKLFYPTSRVSMFQFL